MRCILRLLPGIALVALLLLLDSCAVPLGPGYTIEKRTLDIHFVSRPQPHLEIRASYRLANTGNQPLSSIQIRLPNPDSFDVENLQVQLDGRGLALQTPTGASDKASNVRFDPPWVLKQRHEFTILYAISHSLTESAAAPLAVEDAFYLPVVGWYPELEPPKGVFAKLRGPHKKWNLMVRLPQGFLIHASGHEHGSKKIAGETSRRFEQRPDSSLPFVIAGHYEQREFRGPQRTIYFWTRKSLDEKTANEAGETVSQTMQFLDSSFGPRGKGPLPVWIVECPGKAIPTTGRDSAGIPEGFIGCQPLPDVALVEDISTLGSDSLAESLSPSWLGLGTEPHFAELAAPLDALERYAALAAKENRQGSGARSKDLAESLALYPSSAGKDKSTEKKQRDSPDREKSLFFFYALEDQYGRDHLHHAIARMIHARRGRGYDLDDLRSALEAETGQNVADFFHRWLDKPGVPEDFRARYSQPNSTTNIPKEKQP
ncbi:MAG TPA: hypothetical protein VEU31_04535 [Candidatus Acidoferrales bacterium]|nr:hypothetical protein [Candidatus Acidoferrales bacterium]